MTLCRPLSTRRKILLLLAFLGLLALVVPAAAAAPIVQPASHRALTRTSAALAPAQATAMPPQAPAASMAYSTFSGGMRDDQLWDIAVDAEGYAYVVGSTSSPDRATAGALQMELGNSGLLSDAYVAKIAPNGASLIWATYLGGVREDEGLAIALGPGGSVTVAGITNSENFPTVDALQPKLNLADSVWSGDLFISRFAPDGGSLLWSTFLGGTGRDRPTDIAVDAEGATYLTGWTGSHFPAEKAIYPLNRGIRDAFITKITPDGSAIAWSTHLGGSDRDEGRAIAVDARGAATIVGATSSRNLRIADPFQRTFGGDADGFVARIAPDGQSFEYASYLGGRTFDAATGVALGADGVTYVAGRTDSPNFPRINPFQPSRRGDSDVFVVRISADGSALEAATYFGGTGAEDDCLPVVTSPIQRLDVLQEHLVTQLAVDPQGRVVVAGCTASANLPMVDALPLRRGGAVDGFVAVFNPTLDDLLFSTLVSARALDVPRGVAIDGEGSIYLTGRTDSSDFPSVSAAQPERAGLLDGFALKIGPPFAPPPTATPTATATREPTPVPPTATAPPPATATAASTPTAGVEPTAIPSAPMIYLPIVRRES